MKIKRASKFALSASENEIPEILDEPFGEGAIPTRSTLVE